MMMTRALSICQALRSRIYRETTRRSLSSLKVDPSKYVYNVTKERAVEDPAVAAFLEANYPDAYVEEKIRQQMNELATQDVVVSSDDALDNEASELNIRKLECYLRNPENEEGSRASERLRESHMIPGILYGSDPNLGIFSEQAESKTLIKTPWRLLQRELDRYHRHFESRVYDLTLLESPDDDSGGTVHRVIPKSVQRHPVQSRIYCANFCRYHAGRPIKLPIMYVNEEESPALKRDGFIVPIQRFIECFVEDGVRIPDCVELECTDLQFKDVIRTDRVSLPNGVRFSDRVINRGDDFILGVVFGKRRGADAGEAGDDEEQEE